MSRVWCKLKCLAVTSFCSSIGANHVASTRNGYTYTITHRLHLTTNNIHMRMYKGKDGVSSNKAGTRTGLKE